MVEVTDVLAMIAIGFWVFVPALLPNTFAVFVGGGTPVDFGKSIGGARILGDGKTWRGFIGGALIGGVGIGLCMIGLSALCGSEDHWGFGPDLTKCIIMVTATGFGSLIGDMAGSFIKRRLGINRGQKAPILDQYDFVIGSMVAMMIVDFQWFYNTYLDGWHLVALFVVLFLVWFLHRGTNIIGYKIGVKNEPW